jgi:hypothetical protein
VLRFLPVEAGFAGFAHRVSEVDWIAEVLRDFVTV